MQAITEGRLSDAEKALIELTATEDRHAGAWLDLATLHCASGNSVAAETLFVEIERRFAPPPPILEVIAFQRRLGCKGVDAQTEVSVRLVRGIESNVNQGSKSPSFSIGSGVNQVDLLLLPEYRPRSDQFTSLSAEWSRSLSPAGAAGVVQFQSQAYDHLSRFNTNSIFVGAEFPWRWSDWRLRTAGSASLVALEGQLYLRQNQLQMEVTPPLPISSDWQLSLIGSWSGIEYPTLSGFDSRWWEARATVAYRLGGSGWQASASTVKDLELGQRPGGDRRGVFVGLLGFWELGGGVVGELGWQTQRWQGERVYSPGLIDVSRSQSMRTLRAAATFPLRTGQSLILEYKDTQNHENITLFEYRNQSVQLSWRWQPGDTR